MQLTIGTPALSDENGRPFDPEARITLTASQFGAALAAYARDVAQRVAELVGAEYFGAGSRAAAAGLEDDRTAQLIAAIEKQTAAIAAPRIRTVEYADGRPSRVVEDAASEPAK